MSVTSTFPRRFTRVPCNVAATVAFDDAVYTGICENISVGGAFFKGVSMPSTTEVNIMLCLPSIGPVEFPGEVRHAQDGGFGLRFTRVPSRGLTALCAFVGALQ